jgi:hypothetical protein
LKAKLEFRGQGDPISMTPILGGPFNMPRARPPICSITIMDSESDEEGPDGPGNNTDSDEEDFRVLFGSLAIWLVR